MNEKIPNFFVVGAPKCGTTSLYHYFSQHPEIYLSPIKEPVFFAKDIVEWHTRCKFSNPYFNPKEYFKKPKLYFIHIAYLTKLEHYLALFKNVKNEKAIGEMAVLNLFSNVAAKEIYEFNPEAKIIIILRNPIDRVFSHFLANLRDGRDSNKSFLKTVVDDFEKDDRDCKQYYIEMSLYYNQLKRYLDVFPKSNVKIILFDDYKRNTGRVLKELFEFLGVNPDVDIDFKIKKNESLIPRFPGLNRRLKDIRRRIRSLFPNGVPDFLKKSYHLLVMEREKPVLSRDEREFLLPFFKEDILKTQDLIGEDLSNWLKIE